MQNMSYTKNRTESLPSSVVSNAAGESLQHTYKVGDGCHISVNGDRTPYTIIRISDSGREIVAARDQFTPHPGQTAFTEADLEGTFTPYEFQDGDLTEVPTITFKLRRNGLFTEGPLGGWSYILIPGRRYARNPHI